MFMYDVGVPHELQTDSAKTLIGSYWKKRYIENMIYIQLKLNLTHLGKAS